jgi:hypothetical protein
MKPAISSDAQPDIPDTASAAHQTRERPPLIALLASMLLGIVAQYAIANESMLPGLMLYLAAVVLAAGNVRPRLRYVDVALRGVQPLARDWRMLLGGFGLLGGAATFVASSNNSYTWDGVLLWLCSIGCWWAACADFRPGQWFTTPKTAWTRTWRKLRFARRTFVALGLILLLGAAFRFVDLYDNPFDMNRDHVENLYDMHQVLQVPEAPAAIFFAGNTGREGAQFYLSMGLIEGLGLPLSFITLKITTVLIGMLMLPAIFLLGREVFDTRTALLATFFAAVASWAVLTARFGLRNPLTPLAVAWLLVFLVPGLRRGDRNAMLAVGLWMGIGLQGYTAFRFMVVVVPLLAGFWIGWQYLHGRRHEIGRTLMNSSMALVLALLVTMPLIRYAVDYPDQLLFRAATRISGVENPITDDITTIFLNNIRDVLLVFNYTFDEVWVVSIPFTPTMDMVLGALLVIGAAAAVAQSIRQHNPWPALLLATGVLMLMPSALSLAFPRENPSTMRISGALPPLMLICAVVPGMVLNAARHWRRTGQGALAVVLVGMLCSGVIFLNIDRVFVQYPAAYCPRIKNTRDMATDMAEFLRAGHPRENTWVVEYQDWWWVDARALGLWTGDINFPQRVMGADQVAQIDLGGQAGWFVLHPDDAAALDVLEQNYPEGTTRLLGASQCPDLPEKQFLIFTTQPGS